MLDAFRCCLRDEGLHFSQAREIVVRVVETMDRHFGAEELAEHLGAGTDRVSRGTVYRTLNLLERFGLIRRVGSGRGARRYERTGEGCKHEHFHCDSCGRVFEFEDPGVEKLLQRVCRDNEFLMRSHRLAVLGVCADCARKKEGDGGERRREEAAPSR